MDVTAQIFEPKLLASFQIGRHVTNKCNIIAKLIVIFVLNFLYALQAQRMLGISMRLPTWTPVKAVL